jgi:site-specific DNA recombinase
VEIEEFKMKRSTNAVIYARVSSREQEQEGYSIQAQIKLLLAYASKNGFTILKQFIDIETAKASGRKAFGEMIEFLKRSKNCRTILVEKMDRLSRNYGDTALLEEWDLEIHLVKSGYILSKNAKAQTKFVAGIEMVSAKFYSDNLREEVIKGMYTKAEAGGYPGRAPIGYKNDKANRTLIVDSAKAAIVKWMFEIYASGNVSLLELRKRLRNEFGLVVCRSYLHRILKNTFYIGCPVWGGNTYKGTHETFISSALFENVQSVLKGHNKPRYLKHDIAFRGLLTCAHDDCAVTAELKKGKYVYYRCTGSRGSCDLPRFTETEISTKLASIVEGIRIPDAVVNGIQKSLQLSQSKLEADRTAQCTRYAERICTIRKRMGQAYGDKLDGKITEQFWACQMEEWQSEERRAESALESLKNSSDDSLLSAQRCLELANKAYFLYVTQKPAKQAELLREVLLNCAIDSTSVYPTYRKPFDMISERAKREEWSGREDLNLRPPGPEHRAVKIQVLHLASLRCQKTNLSLASVVPSCPENSGPQESTQCLSCSRLSPHSLWYAQ